MIREEEHSVPGCSLSTVFERAEKQHLKAVDTDSQVAAFDEIAEAHTGEKVKLKYRSHYTGIN